jgi:putative iron-regulated protein
MVQDILGVLNVYNGSYTRTDKTSVSGPSVKDVVEANDPELADEVEARILESLALAEALHPPFDQEIASDNEAGRARVQALVESLQIQEQLLQEVFRGFGLAIPDDPA